MSKNLDELVDQALQNAIEDRDKALEAYNKMKEALSVETTANVQTAMLVGTTAVSLLDQLSRSNEQIVKLSQIIERREARTSKDKKRPLDLEDLKKAYFDDDENEFPEKLQ